MNRPVVITGIGLVSSLGEGTAVHLEALKEGRRGRIETERFAPYSAFAAPLIEWDRQIAKKADQRQMEPWQKLGVYAAGLALEDAGLKEDAAAKAAMQLVVSAGGGERDEAVDGQVLTGLRAANDPGAFLNEKLMGDLRPTLFLAQLSNLLAGNIAIVHGVTGASRTFMGEELAGVDALRIAAARIAAGQAETMLVGGSYNAERADSILIFALAQHAWKGPFASVWDREAGGGGMVTGSGAAFLVLEPQESAERRGARSRARLMPVISTRPRPNPDGVAAAFRTLWSELHPPAGATILSGAAGGKIPTAGERIFLDEVAAGRNRHSLADHLGNAMEAGAPIAAAIGAALIESGAARDVVATSAGYRHGAGLVHLTALR